MKAVMADELLHRVRDADPVSKDKRRRFRLFRDALEARTEVPMIAPSEAVHMGLIEDDVAELFYEEEEEDWDLGSPGCDNYEECESCT